MAGIWNRWENNGDALETVTILTTEQNDVMKPIHDRMRVVLPRSWEDEWLNGSPDEAPSLCEPYPADDIVAYPISNTVNDPANDRPDVILEAETEQSDFYEFGS